VEIGNLLLFLSFLAVLGDIGTWGGMEAERVWDNNGEKSECGVVLGSERRVVDEIEEKRGEVDGTTESDMG
jgi:hypothetical protein